MSITSIVHLAAGKISDLLVEEAKLLYGVKSQVQSLKEELEMVQSFLNVMEAMEEEEGGDKLSRTTINQVRKIAYDAEDVVESYILEANYSSTHETKKEFLKRYLCFCSSLLRAHQVGYEIEAITSRLNKTIEMWKKYAGENGMLGADARQGLNMKTRLRMIKPIAYPHIHEEHVVGLDEDINKLVKVLTHTEHHNINVVSVVGMGGSGKTTLARRLYNHESVKKHFDCIAWVSVSQQWDAKKIILDLLNKVTRETVGAGETSEEKLHQYLEMKNFLIVLDDVWESKALTHIRPAFPLAGDKRKIIVTTRNEEVVNYPDLKPLTYSHEPRRLTDEESWDLFRKIALIHRQKVNNFAISAELEELGKEMLKKCRGLPLAVIALAGILFDKENLEEWEKVSRAVSSRIMEQGKGTQLYGPVKDMLALSYIDLPRELKPCFLYLARYPEDFKIRVGDLIRTWIAEGFITPREGWTLEDVAHGYLEELVHRCLVLVVERNCERKVKRIQIHDLVRDLCIEKTKEEDFLEAFTPTTSNSNTTMTESRRIVAICSTHDRNLLPILTTSSQHLRSLFIRGFGYSLSAQSQNLSLEAVHSNFRLLRVLVVENIWTCSSNTLPKWIGSMIHLRYLGLLRMNIIELPSSIGNLRNLLTLDWDTHYTTKGAIRIPDVLWKLEGLTHLHLPRRLPYEDDMKALKLHTLKYLQTLKMSGVEGDNWMLEELPRLTPSIQKLTIHDIGSEKLLEAAFRCPSIRSNRLRSLCLSWRDGITLKNVEDSIMHCQYLRILRLHGRMVGDGLIIQFPASINKLELLSTGFEAEATLIALGKLPHLTLMSLDENAYTGKRWTCRAGEFPQIKELSVIGSEKWEEWSIERGAMPRLMKLTIYECKKLRKLPEGLKFITTLKYLKLGGSLCDEFKDRIKAGGEDVHIIQHVPRVVIF